MVDSLRRILKSFFLDAENVQLLTAYVELLGAIVALILLFFQ
ncbi:hypothetical protein BMWSH_4457 [Priestia megaterium WSH-002]|uniref:Uncharacterized protein n=1 Tax=Priestia megaterium (strain WSH-002) TaxID=1006007 RepID=A0A8D3X5I5_PRIMW|nr:hypothetical protein BMWSH_4457 [Priestia megaterium WSH-002]